MPIIIIIISWDTHYTRTVDRMSSFNGKFMIWFVVSNNDLDFVVASMVALNMIDIHIREIP